MLTMQWHRFGNDRVDVCTDFTKLTLDTIAFSTFSYRFNSFYREQNHPFVDAMAGSLRACGDRLRRIPGTGWMYVKANKKYKEDIQLLHDLADNVRLPTRLSSMALTYQLVKERQDSGERMDDLLDRLLHGRDHVTGKGLSTENIRYQLVTFLIAGHEVSPHLPNHSVYPAGVDLQTTSGMLSFLFHFLLQSPASLQKVRQEVDRVCGDKPVRFEQLQKLEYVDAALKETLRLKSTAPAFGVTAKNGDETLGGKYRVPHGQNVMIVLDALHLDPKVWGDDAEVFK
jgi:cytochrome P450/NADPH-cytochrome P450 reductase